MMNKSKKTLKRLFNLIEAHGRESSYKYFFEQIIEKADATLLQPLRKRGYFKNPPEVKHSSDGWVETPFWLPMNYLVKMASVKPGLVTEIVSDIPTVDNPRICNMMMEIATKLPMKQSMEIKTNVLKYVSKSSSIWGDEAAKLLTYWSKYNQTEAALELLQELVRFSADPEDKEKRRRRKDYNEQLGDMEKVQLLVGTGLEPSHRMDAHFYRELMHDGVPQLIEKEPYKSAHILIKAVSNMIKLKSHDDGINYYDWNIQFEQGSEPLNDQQKGHKRLLIDAMILACDKVYESQEDKIAKLDKVLRDLDPHFFRRQRLLLYTKYPSEVTKPWIRKLITEHNEYGKQPLGQSFWNMIKNACEHFGEELLTVEERTEIFTAINGASFGTDHTRSYTENDLRRTQFFPFESVLFGEYKGIFQELKDTPIEEKKDPPNYTPKETERRSSYDRSPYSHDDLASFSDKELLDRINGWNDEKQFTEDNWIITINRTGFAAMLFDVFKESVVCSSKKMKFWLRSCDEVEYPVYLREMVFAMHEQIKTGKYDMFNVYLKFCKRVLSYSDEKQHKAQSKEMLDQEPGWSSPRWAVCELVSSYLEREIEPDPSACIELQTVLTMLCTQYDRELDGSKQKNYDKRSILNKGINTIRGSALAALVKFASAVHKYKDNSNLLAAQQIIEQRLSPQATYAMQPEEYAILGVNYPHLRKVGKKWTTQHKSSLFPQDRPKSCAAALGALIGYNKPCKPMFEIVRDNFDFIMQHLDEFRSKDTYGENLLNPLEIQLFSFYLAGEYSLTGEDSLLDQYYAKTASDKKRRGKLLYTVGDNLRNESDKFSEDELKKILDFFKKRLADGDFVEMDNYSPWLDTQQLDINDRLSACLKVLDTCEIESFSTHIWLKKFCKMLPDHTMEVVKCFEKLVCRDDEGIFHINKDQVKTIVTAGRKSGDEVCSYTDCAVNCLLKKGLINIDDLEG